MLITVSAYAETLDIPNTLPYYDFGSLIKVVDGDTIKMDLFFRGTQNIRIRNLDAYETRRITRAYKQIQQGETIEDVIKKGKLAKQALNDTLKNKVILLTFGDCKYGFYGRLVATILISNCEGSWTNLALFMEHTYPQLYLPMK
jgi:endonuclease YncB( thermonuclease family)